MNFSFGNEVTNFYLKISADNGFNPIWDESCQFEIANPDYALLRFVVQDEDVFGDNNFIGQATYPVSIPFLKAALLKNCNKTHAHVFN